MRDDVPAEGGLVTGVADPQAQLYAALAKAQGEFPPIPRSKTVRVKGKTKASADFEYTFNYAPLDAIIAAVRPKLTENGLSISQFLTSDDGRPAIQTIIMHAGGGSISGTLPIKTEGLDPQGVGSLVTYVRRYALVSALGIASEDDDDGGAANRAPRADASANGSEKKANASQVREVEKLIADLNESGALGETEVRDRMQVEYGTIDSKALTATQAADLVKRLKAKAAQGVAA